MFLTIVIRGEPEHVGGMPKGYRCINPRRACAAGLQ